MWKETIIIIIILIIVIGGNLLAQSYTKNSVEMMNEKIDILSEILVDQDNAKKEIKQKYEQIIYICDDRFKILAYYIEHDELEKVKTELVVLGANIEVEEYEKGLEELEKCKYILEHIQEKEEFSLMNVF